MNKNEKQDEYAGLIQPPKAREEVESQAKKSAITPQGSTELLAYQDILVLKDLLGSFSEQTGAFFG